MKIKVICWAFSMLMGEGETVDVGTSVSVCIVCVCLYRLLKRINDPECVRKEKEFVCSVLSSAPHRTYHYQMSQLRVTASPIAAFLP